MASNQRYFLIPFESVPANPGYTVWFASWSTARPFVEPGMNPPLVVGVTAAEELPAGAISLSSGGTKDPPPPPPPPPPLTYGESEYRQTVSAWLGTDRDQDE